MSTHAFTRPGDRVIVSSAYPRYYWPAYFTMDGVTATVRARRDTLCLLEVDGLTNGHGAGRHFWWVGDEYLAPAVSNPDPVPSTKPMSPKLKAVLDHLISGRTLTQGEAIVLGYGTRLADLIHRLKKRGHDIRCTMKTDIHGAPYGEYKLVTRNRFGDVKKAA